MSSSDNALDLVSELQLTLGPSNHCIQGGFSGEYGVGANAASGKETPEMVGNSFSELVWCPRSGLSLKNSIGSVAGRKSPLVLGTGPSMANKPPSSFETDKGKEKIGEERNYTAFPMITPDGKDKLICKSEFGRDPGFTEEVVETNSSSYVNIAQDDLVGSKSLREEDLVFQGDTVGAIEATESNSSGLHSGRKRSVLPVLENTNARPVELMHGGLNKVESCDSPVLNEEDEQTQRQPIIKGDSHHEVIGLRNPMDDALMPNAPSMWQRRIQLNMDLMEANKFRSIVKFVSNSDVGIKKRLQRGKGKFALEHGEVSKASPIRALASERKGKEKIVPYGAMKKIRPGEDSDGYGSNESCESTRRSGVRKKRVLDFEEHATSGHKRVKMHIQEAPAYKSSGRTDGSFMTWISMLMKGSSRPNEDRSPFLRDANNEDKVKATVAFSREEDTKSGSTGFKSIFQSLGRSNPKVPDQRFISDTQKSEGFTVVDQKSGSDDLMALEQKTVSNDGLRQSVLAGDQHPLTLVKGSVASFPSDCKDAVRKWKTDTGGENNVFSSEEKSADDYGNKRKQLSQLWLSHFCTKSSTVDASKGSDNISGFAHNSRNNIGCFRVTELSKQQGHSSQEPSCSSSKKLHSFSLDNEVACAVKGNQAKRVNPVAHNHRFKSSETIGSIFAKRFDGLKQIMQDRATSSAAACLFCGITGHDLRNCPQLTETDVDDLLTNITTFDEAEGSPCFCIKCFQLNHWAVSCPNAPSMKRNRSEHDKLWHQKGFEEVFDVKAGCGSSPRHHRLCTTDADPDVALEVNGSSAWMGNVLQNVEKINAPGDEENDSEALGTSYPHSSFGRPVMNIPSGIFEALKFLRLSRCDILRYTHSSLSIPHLDGYYVRLRRTMLAEGFQGAGHYVACISGLHEESAECLKQVIPVIVGGIRRRVETQCISDQDFLEDELMAWWSMTIGGGGKVPSEGELLSKMEERSRLGF